VTADRFAHKQVIAVRRDLRMSPGKLAVQVAHAACMAAEMAMKRCPEVYEAWKREGAKKVVVAVGSEEELLEVYNQAERLGLPRSIVRDAGLTELPPGTLTAVAVGPHRASEVDRVTGRLPLLR